MYLDTCIIVKLLVQEADSALFEQTLAGELLSSSELASVEVWATLLAKERSHQIGAQDRQQAWRQFQTWVADDEIRLHPLNAPVLRTANHLLSRCHPQIPLRTLDALHVAVCDISRDFPLCTTDRRMREAAAMLGIPLLPAH